LDTAHPRSPGVPWNGPSETWNPSLSRLVDGAWIRQPPFLSGQFEISSTPLASGARDSACESTIRGLSCKPDECARWCDHRGSRPC
jgi:hypothetical protein